MTTDELKRAVWINSLTSYLRIVLGVVLGLFTFRLLWNELSLEEFGFWALLWSIFGYGILMDLGFGLATQKKVAALTDPGQTQELNRFLSSVFILFLALAVALVAAALFVSPFLIEILRVSAANRSRFHDILNWFLCGAVLTLPFGIFYEILFGQQRIALANSLAMAATAVNFVLLVLAVRFGWGLKAILLIALSCTLIRNVVAGVLALRVFTGVRLHPKYFSWAAVREASQFSFYAYVFLVTNVALAQSNRLLIGIFLSVAAVSLYQPGAKVAELLGTFTRQLPEVLSPAAAHFNARGNRAGVQKLLVQGTRFNVLGATPLYLLCAFYLEGLLQILTGEKNPGPHTYWIGQILLFWVYTGIITHSVSKPVFLMCGYEKRLTRLAVIEALANLLLTISLLLIWPAVLAAAFGTLFPTLVVGWLYLWPWMAREAALSVWQLARTVLARTWLACVPLLLFIAAARAFAGFEPQPGLWPFFTESSLAAGVAAAGLWRWGLTAEERSRLTAWIGRRWRPRLAQLGG